MLRDIEADDHCSIEMLEHLRRHPACRYIDVSYHQEWSCWRVSVNSLTSDHKVEARGKTIKIAVALAMLKAFGVNGVFDYCEMEEGLYR